ncbi:MAG: acetyl-CoA carboxylase carboxyltransferase subunit beta [Clostridiales bacterium]|nr:acetyl-CoA carboxylase carboxyltransferase subunit beta [Clostridiales bacterium]
MNLFSEQIEHESAAGRAEATGMLDMLRCARCGRDLVAEVVLAGDAACPYCGSLFRQPAYRRIEAIVDSGSFIEIEREAEPGDPLSFPGYRTKLEKEQEKSKMQEGVVIGKATIKGLRTALAVMDSYFMMGSMGTVVGEKIVILAEFALHNRLPLVIFCASGGARMQEGVLSLMQMSRTTIALARHSAAGLLHINVLTHPTTGGVTASFAMQGDITLAEPGALIGFAGPRVIEQTVRDKLPEGFQTAEYLYAHGLIDRIVDRRDLRETLASLLALHNIERAAVPEKEGRG